MDEVKVIAEGEHDQYRDDEPAIVQPQLHTEQPHQLDLRSHCFPPLIRRGSVLMMPPETDREQAGHSFPHAARLELSRCTSRTIFRGDLRCPPMPLPRPPSHLRNRPPVRPVAQRWSPAWRARCFCCTCSPPPATATSATRCTTWAAASIWPGAMWTSRRSSPWSPGSCATPWALPCWPSAWCQRWRVPLPF